MARKPLDPDSPSRRVLVVLTERLLAQTQAALKQRGPASMSALVRDLLQAWLASDPPLAAAKPKPAPAAKPKPAPAAESAAVPEGFSDKVKPVDYALIMHHAVRHVGLKLEGAAPAALSFAELTRGYSHPNPADFSRVRRHEKLEDNAAAIDWIIRRAVAMLDGGVAVDGDQVSFAPGKSFDDLNWTGGKVERPGPDPLPLPGFSDD